MQRAGLDGLYGPFQFYDFMITCPIKGFMYPHDFSKANSGSLTWFQVGKAVFLRMHMMGDLSQGFQMYRPMSK